MVKILIRPLSSNRAWQGRRFKSSAYKAYEEQLGYLLPARYPIHETRALKITIEAGFSNKLSDLDNICKQFIDVLQKVYKFNDNRINEIHLFKEIVDKGQEYIAFEIV